MMSAVMLRARLPSPLAEGRELKFPNIKKCNQDAQSPLAEGRELKCRAISPCSNSHPSPLAEGRELKLTVFQKSFFRIRVAPRGGA